MFLFLRTFQIPSRMIYLFGVTRERFELMANILYGINGEGSGHWTRSREVISYLRESGHDVVVATSGRALANMKGTFPVEAIFGFKFEFNKDRVDSLATFFQNVGSASGAARSLRKISRLIRKRNIDLVVTDFEPVSSFTGYLNGIPVVSVDNQHFITNTDADYPDSYSNQARVTKAAINMMVSGAAEYLAISFFDAKATRRETTVLPPILRREVALLEPHVDDYILVYVTHGRREISDILKQIDFKFVVYGAGGDGRDGNVVFKQFSQDGFLSDLAGSGGVLATAGFSLISEALYLGKPYLAWPVKNQFEQVFNAHHVERLGYGKFMDDLNVETVESFLFNLRRYRGNLKSYSRRDNELLFDSLDKAIRRLA